MFGGTRTASPVQPTSVFQFSPASVPAFFPSSATNQGSSVSIPEFSTVQQIDPTMPSSGDLLWHPQTGNAHANGPRTDALVSAMAGFGGTGADAQSAGILWQNNIGTTAATDYSGGNLAGVSLISNQSPALHTHP
jgi:hypothetical protein